MTLVIWEDRLSAMAAAAGVVFMVLLIVLAAAFYFFPSLVALCSKKRNIGAIAALNILAGWTGAGWIIALVWALAVDGPVYRGESG
jgi:hypothetical protein